MSIIIQHLFAGISANKIGLSVHKGMHKENSSTLTKSINDIKITNKIILSYYYHIFGHSFGIDILPLMYDYNMNHNFYKTRKKIKRCRLCSRTSYNKFWNQYCLESDKIVNVSNISFHISNRNTYKLYSVFVKTKRWIYI